MSTGIFKQRKITLNNISGIPSHTGSTFLVEYSTDYVNFYTSSIDLFVSENSIGPSIGPFTGSIKWNEVYLPYAGATASVLLPTGSVAMRLTDLEYPTSQYTEIF
jgi:hypothetical protein